MTRLDAICDVREAASLVAGLQGKTLAMVVASGLAGSAAVPSESQLGQLAVVRTARRAWGEEGQVTAPFFDVVCAEDPEFWNRVAQKLQELPPDQPAAERLQAAFRAAVAPGELFAA